MRYSISNAIPHNPKSKKHPYETLAKSRLSGLDEAKNDEFTTDLPQLTQDTSEKKTLSAMAVFFYAPYSE